MAGYFDIDVNDVVEYIARKRAEGVRLTITHFTAAAVSRALYEDIPDINCYVKRGKIVYREDANVCVSISVEGGKGMSAYVIPKTQELSATQISKLIREKAAEKRAGKESGGFGAKDTIGRIPWPLRRPVFRLIKWILFELGLPIPFLKLPKDPFGSTMLTNIGVFGLEYGSVALFPIGKLPFVITMGALKQKPTVRDGEIVIRWFLPVSGTFDHRIVDGAQIGELANGVVKHLSDPEALDRPNPPREETADESES